MEEAITKHNLSVKGVVFLVEARWAERSPFYHEAIASQSTCETQANTRVSREQTGNSEGPWPRVRGGFTKP